MRLIAFFRSFPASLIYMMFVQPFFRKHEARIDGAMDAVNEKVGKAAKAGIEKAGAELRQRLSK